jgi:hypothetical protein
MRHKIVLSAVYVNETVQYMLSKPLMANRFGLFGVRVA